MKEEYIKPAIETIEVNIEGVIATSPGGHVDVNDEDEYTGTSYSRRRFWDAND